MKTYPVTLINPAVVTNKNSAKTHEGVTFFLAAISLWPLMKTKFDSIPAVLADIRQGKMVIVVDDADRENEGDLILAAEKATPQKISFMVRYTSGVICVPMAGDDLDRLGLPLMIQQNQERMRTAYTISVDATNGISTGISAADRAHTVQVAISPRSGANDLARPGHIFPLRARKGGVLVRAGQTEASVDLARMAGLIPAGVICEIMNDDGTMARVPDLIEFCTTHSLKMVTVAELIRYRLQNERYVHRVAEAQLPTAHGEFRMIAYKSEAGIGEPDAVEGGESHIALTLGDLSGDAPALVRVHTHCLAGNVFGSTLCDCAATVDASLRAIATAGRGALIYLHQTQRGFGIDATLPTPRLVFHRSERTHELRAGAPCDQPDQKRDQKVLRQVGLGGQILSDLGIRKIRLLSNQPTHIPALQGFGIEIVERVPIELPFTARSG
jgi:3,4-dihydroxy 2-butanone 4-phosphate synthase/GTP cyclohydrolase II